MSSLPDRLLSDQRRAVPFVLDSGAAIPSQLLVQARADAAAVGYAQGWAQGHREARDARADEVIRLRAESESAARRHAEQLCAALDALAGAAQQLQAREQATAAALEFELARAAVQIATALLGAELADPAVSSITALSRVLGLAPQGQPITVRLSPGDHRALTVAGGAMAHPGDITLMPDVSLRDGDAVAVSGASTIDARLSAAIGRVEAHLADRAARAHEAAA
jgi:flagellar assembly protein FliH